MGRQARTMCREWVLNEATLSCNIGARRYNFDESVEEGAGTSGNSRGGDCVQQDAMPSPLICPVPMPRARGDSFLQRVPVEALFWAAALIGVASIDPQTEGITLCLLEHLGLPCPGEGLGRAIALLARGQFAASWAMHPLAGPAVGMIGLHVIRLCRRVPLSSAGDHSSHASFPAASSHV